VNYSAQIQEKEAARAKLEIMRRPEEVKELRMLETSMKMVPILKTYFLLEKKASVPLHSVVVKVQESYSSQLSPGEESEGRGWDERGWAGELF